MDGLGSRLRDSGRMTRPGKKVLGALSYIPTADVAVCDVHSRTAPACIGTTCAKHIVGRKRCVQAGHRNRAMSLRRERKESSVAQQKKHSQDLVAVDVKDKPVTDVLEMLSPRLGRSLVYSKTALSDAQGREHLITARINGAQPETALIMIAHAVGLEVESYGDEHLVVRPSTFKPISDLFDEEVEEEGGAEDESDLPF
jgi:hypothetical protein